MPEVEIQLDLNHARDRAHQCNIVNAGFHIDHLGNVLALLAEVDSSSRDKTFAYWPTSYCRTA
jgi:hypothetical protein